MRFAATKAVPVALIKILALCCLTATLTWLNKNFSQISFGESEQVTIWPPRSWCANSNRFYGVSCG